MMYGSFRLVELALAAARWINIIEISDAIGGGFQARRHLKPGTALAEQMHPKGMIDLENVELKAFWSLRGVKANTNNYKSWEMAAWSSCVRSSFRLRMKSLLRNRLKIWHIRSWWRTRSSPSFRRRTPSHVCYDCGASPERFLVCTPPCVKVLFCVEILLNSELVNQQCSMCSIPSI
jgi:hypothetical protein